MAEKTDPTEEIENSTLWEDITQNDDEQEESIGESPIKSTCNQEYHKSGMQYLPGQGMSRYNPALKNLILVRRQKKKKSSLGIDEASFWSFITYNWISKFLYEAYKKGLTLDDIPEISPYDSSEYNVQRLEAIWLDELAQKGPQSASLGRVAWKFIRTRAIVSTVLVIVQYILAFCSLAFFMRCLLEYSEDPTASYSEGIKWALLLTVNELIRVILYSLIWAINYRTAVRLRSAFLAMLYRKILRLSSLEDKSSGELVNLFSNDGQKIFCLMQFAPSLFGGPISVILLMLYVFWYLGPWALLGFSTFILFYALQFGLSRLEAFMRRKAILGTDERISLVTEILNSIKVIKLYGWNTVFSSQMKRIRNNEVKYVRLSAYCESLGSSLSSTGPTISTIVAFLVHIACGNILLASQAFTVLALSSRMLTNFLNFTRDGLRSIFDFKISIQRFKKILLLNETKTYLSRPLDKSQSVCIASANFARYTFFTKSALDDSKGNERKKYENNHADNSLKDENTVLNPSTPLEEVLFDINFYAPKGHLIGICGQVGCGKSSLLNAIMGQLTMTQGKLCREGSCAYVSQQPWLLNATLKENILFGEKFDAKRYFQALYCCSLNEDVNMLPGGDETEIGERGINLSGGQKQRVSLARALYADRDIYLLDDPLSSVDNQVANHIFEKYILSALKGKTVLFVTHQLKFLEKCDDIIVMKGGTIISRGKYSQLTEEDVEFKNLISSIEHSQENEGATKSTSTTIGDTEASNKDVSMNGALSGTEINPGGVLVTSEKIQRGSIKLDTISCYLNAAGGYFISFIIVLIMLLNVGTIAFSSWWLALWIKFGIHVENLNETAKLNGTEVVDTDLHNESSLFQLVYILSILGIIISNLIRGFTFTKVAVKASSLLHDTLFNKVLKGPMQFFETTPIGRLHNLFAKDIDEIERWLPSALERILIQLWQFVFAIFFISLVFPYFIIPLFLILILFYAIIKIFRVGIRDLKRLDNLSRSPIFSNVSITIQGLSTIHAFRKEKEFIHKFMSTFDQNSTCLFMNSIAARWLAVRLDTLSVIILAITSTFIIFLHDSHIPAAMAGLAIAYASTISGSFQFIVRLLIELESKFLSVERLSTYISGIEQEGGHGPKGIPPVTWPELGTIRFNHVKFCYRLGLPLALNDINFKVRPGEKIGIVGRTGSGKSTLISALFRLVELSPGSIKIDNLDIATLDLDILRTRLSVIPQDPVLFVGTVRFNLDPVGLYSDSDIWSALEKTKLKDKISSLEEKLDFQVSQNGDNFSVGEKQLLCLARVILRQSKIVILDEATASVDLDTDSILQQTIRDEFKQSTVLMITHRLQTIMFCDRLVVLSNGQVVEIDEPNALLNNSNSLFSKMMTASSCSKN